MEQSGIQEILHALKLHSAHIDEKLNIMATKLEIQIDEKFDRMEERFDRSESKLNGFRVELTETQETVDYLTIKNAQHEKKLRPQIGK
ncbi:MAG: hypothetical protein K0S80_3792 [Neobacillus sp.]|nr:hypothetical protein [Neobacillus sp.]